jgi:hypothetical protein
MKRVLTGALALVVIAIAGLFVIHWYVQDRAAREVETAFAQIRSTGAKASHGKVSFDPLTQTVTIADIAAETGSQPPVSVKIGSLVAAGVGRPDAGRVAAASIEASDLEIVAQTPAPSSVHIAYKAPRIGVKDYAGPDHGEQPPVGASPIALYGALLRQFAAISASSVSIPTLTGEVVFGATTPGRGTFTYTGLALEGIKDGRIASQKVSDARFTIDTQQSGKPQRMTGHIVDISCFDIDTTVMAAVLDPQGTDDRVRRVYRQASVGGYELTAEPGAQMHLDRMTIDEFGLRPSKLQLPALLTLVARPAGDASPAEMHDLADKIANLYEGLAIGNAEMRGLSLTTPEGPVKLASFRADMRDGKADLAVEGLDGKSRQGPITLGRFALKAFDLAGMVRIAAQFSDPAQRPMAAIALELFTVLSGAELKDVVAPYKATDKQVRIENISLDWGQFVGPIPTRAHLGAKINSPIDPSNPVLQPLLAAGVDTAAVDVDLGASWKENAGTFALAPVKFDIGSIAAISASLSLAHVPRDIFTVDPQAAMAQAAQIEAAGLELTLHDLGGLDILIAQTARTQNIGKDEARAKLIAGVKAFGDELGSDNSDVAGAVAAISRFVEAPHQTLTLKLIPRARVPALQLVQLLGSDPATALAEFRIEASTGL